MKNLYLLFALLMSSALFAQTQYTANQTVENPPYGLVTQIWNAGTTPIYLDGFTVAAAPNLPLPHGGNATLPVSFLEFGWGESNLEENQCTAVQTFVVGTNLPTAGPASVRVSGQPCTPNGRAYGIPNGNGTYNYTPTNFIALTICTGNNCALIMPVTINPGTGVTVYTAAYDGVNGFGWTGYLYTNLTWHDHIGCATQSTDPKCIR